MEKNREHVEIQYDIATLLARSAPPKTIAPKVLRAVCEKLGWPVGVLWILDKQQSSLRCDYFWRSPRRRVARYESITRRLRFKRGIGLIGRVWESGRPAWILNMTTDRGSMRSTAAGKDGLHGVLAFPVHVNGEVVAVLEFACETLKSPDRSVLQPIAAAASQLGQFLERHRVQEDLLRQNAVLSAQQVLSPEGILVVDQNGRIASFNHRFVSMWGIPDAVIKRGSDDEALASVLGKLKDPRGFIARVNYLYRHRRQRSREELELTDGRIFERYSAPIFSGENIYLGRVWYFQDATERRRAEAKLAASEEKYHKLFTSATSAILIFDAKTRRIVDANTAAQRLYGYTLKEFFSLSYANLSAEPAKTGKLPPPTRKTTRAALRYHKRKNGTKFPVEITISYFSIGGRRMIIGMLTDISDRLKAQETVNLKQKAAVARDFIANVSHELRTPTAAILGFSETLLRGALKQPRLGVDFVKTIHRHALHLNRLIEDLLDLASLDSGKAPSRTQTIDLSRYLADFTTSESLRLRKKNISMRINPRKSTFISMDETQLRRVLSNLLENAVKYTPIGGRITVSLRASFDRAVISVADSGIGISKKDLPLIFNRFHRAETSVAHGIKGTGLGLALVKEIVTSQGGSVWAESSEGAGSTFFVALPALTRRASFKDSEQWNT